MTFKELDKLLQQNGWYQARSKGSHFHYRHNDKPDTIAVPNHSGKDIKKGTLHSILKQAGLK
jgi:Predicted periplasmic or secreted lipoprotein